MASKSQRWVVDSGILRKKQEEEEPQELLVFGYSCKLFKDDERARFIDQGKHLIPWMGDNTHKIDRYDGRGALGDLRLYEPPPGGFDLRTILTEEEYKIEQLCDEERYKSLYNNEAEEAMYHEEEIKRLHQALNTENSYNQVAFNYDEEKKFGEDSQSPKLSEVSQEEDAAFVPDPELEVPENMIIPESQKLNAIIEKTALFISRQGGQMEILIKMKQADNPQFAFLSIDGELHPYYKHVLEAIKSGKYNPEKQLEKEEPAPKEKSEDEEEKEDEDDDDDSYLHPSLVSSLKVEAAPSIPSISYKPSADCAYSMLVNKITGKPPAAKVQQQPEIIPPPPMPPMGYYPPMAYPPYPNMPQQYAHGPVIYNTNGNTTGMPVPPMPPTSGSSTPTPPNNAVPQIPQKEPTPLVPYGPTPPKPLNRPSFIVPPADVQIIIDKMASYVAKNGRDFEAIVKSKGDPRFNFLELSHQYHGYYAHKLTIYEGAVNPRVLTEEELLQKQELQEEKQKKLEELQKKQQRMEEVQKRVKMIQEKKKSETGTRTSLAKQVTTVSFSIKKPKEGENTVIEKRNALPQEESDDEAGNDEKKEENSSKPQSPAPAPEEKVEKIPSPKLEKESGASEKPAATEKRFSLRPPVHIDRPVVAEKKVSSKQPAATKQTVVAKPSVATKQSASAIEKPVTDEKKVQSKQSSATDRFATTEKKIQTKQPNSANDRPILTAKRKTPSKQTVDTIDKPISTEKKPTAKPSVPVTDITDIVDLTDDLFDDYQEAQDRQTEKDKIRDRMLMVAAREKLNASREKQLQMERRKKAAMFLSQIQAPTLTKHEQTKHEQPTIVIDESSEPTAPALSREELEIEELRMCTNSLMSKLRSGELSRRRSKPRSRSRSSSADYSDHHHRSHKKHKKKKSSHKSSYRESISSSRSHKSKKSKKSSSRHRSRSRSSHRHYASSSRHRREESSSSDSETSSS